MKLMNTDEMKNENGGISELVWVCGGFAAIMYGFCKAMKKLYEIAARDLGF